MVIDMLKKQAFLRNALILTASSFLLRSVWMSFRVYISSKIGTEGMGLYQLTFSIYFMASTFATSGINLAVTRLITEAIAKGSYRAANQVMRRCFLYSIFFGVTASITVYSLSPFIGKVFLQDARTIISLKTLAFSLPFLSLTSCLSGYFYANRKVIKSISAQIFEQLVNIIILVVIIDKFAVLGLEYACCAVVISSTAAEIFCCGFGYLLYLLEKRKHKNCGQLQSGVLKSILAISLPVAASSYLRAGLQTVENILIPQGLRKFGDSGSASLAGYGMLMGMVMPLLFFPSFILSSFAMLLIPELTEANVLHHKQKISYAATRAISLTLLFAIPVTGLFMVFCREFGCTIYKSEEIGDMLRILAPLIPMMYLDSIVDGMLKGLGQQLNVLKYSTIDSLLSIVLIYFFVPIYGLRGFIVIIYISTLLNAALSINRLIKVSQVRVNLSDWFIKPTLSIATAALSVKLLCRVLSLNHPDSVVVLVLKVSLSVILYVIFCRMSGAISKADVKWFRSIFKGKDSLKPSLALTAMHH